MLSSDLSQHLWLTLADFSRTSTTSKEWMPIFEVAIQLASTLLSVGRFDALETCVAMTSLLQGHLTTFLEAIRESVRDDDVKLAVTTSSFISSLMRYHKQVQYTCHVLNRNEIDVILSVASSTFYHTASLLSHHEWFDSRVYLLVATSVLTRIAHQSKEGRKARSSGQRSIRPSCSQNVLYGSGKAFFFHSRVNFL
jgi:hypothetical protein